MNDPGTDNLTLIANVRSELRKLSGQTTSFTRMIVPGSQNVLGIRLPALRKLAKTILRDDPRAYLRANPQEYYEERLLQCFVLGVYVAHYYICAMPLLPIRCRQKC